MTPAPGTVPLWQREAPLDGSECGSSRERWRYCDGTRSQTFDLLVRTGKSLDVLGFKGASHKDTLEYAAHLRAAAAKLYAPDVPRNAIESCPCCGSSSLDSSEAVTIFGIPYRRCSLCGHGYVGEQPATAVLNDVFSQSDIHSQTYVDRDATEFRIANVVIPKLDWLSEVYCDLYGRQPRTLLDVGAGGGHFIAAAQRRGIRADGYEVSLASQRFAEEVFGLSLRDGNFLSETAGGHVDVVTMWGLLEYTPSPRDFLAAVRKHLGPDGLLVVEVPRLSCLGTAVQRLSPETVARHLDPTSHVNTFTDSSLATALVTTGFRPVAVWYFGMDIYEVMMQQAVRLGDDGVLTTLSDWIPTLQACLDEGRLCDDMVMAAVPDHE